MVPTSIFIIIFGIIFSIAGITSSFRIFKLTRLLLYHHKSLEKEFLKDRDFPQVLIFIPVFKEMKVLKRALFNFSQIRYPVEKVKIIIVTTEKEFEYGHFSPNSIEIAQREISKLNKSVGRELFLHIHYPFFSGVKSDQLNYGINKLRFILPNLFQEKTYIGIYDIDSLIPRNTLELLACDAIKNKFPDVYQQPTLYFKNYQSLNNTINGFLARSFAFLQTVYAVSYEAFNFLKQSEVIQNNKKIVFKYKMRYCIGHGFFIRWPYFKQLNFFPTPIEDTRIGHIISYLKEDIRLLPVFDNVEVARGIMNRIRQSSNWFWGEVMFLEDFRIAKKIKIVLTGYGLWISFYKFYRNTLWILKGLAFAIFIIWSFLTANFLFAFATIFLFLYLPVICILINSKLLQSISAKKFYEFKMSDLVLVLFIPLEFILMSIGPLLGFLKFYLWRLTGFHPVLYKTEK